MHSILALIETDWPAIERMLEGRSFTVAPMDDANCRLLTEQFVISIGWHSRERWITSSIQLTHLPDSPLVTDGDIDTWMWLKSLGHDWPQPIAENMTSRQLRDELDRIGIVIRQILHDATRTKEALIFSAGYTQGYNDYYAIRENAPPTTIVDRVVGEIRRVLST